jgi:hypothetical protein
MVRTEEEVQALWEAYVVMRDKAEQYSLEADKAYLAFAKADRQLREAEDG